MSTMLNWLNTHRLIIVIILISLALISSVASRDRNSERNKRRRYRPINCAKYVFAPRCRGVSAKRSSSVLYPQLLPLTNGPDVNQLFKKSLLKEEEDALSPLPGLILPRAYYNQRASDSKLERLLRLQKEQQEEQQHQMVRSVLQLIRERSEDQPEAEETRSQWSRNLLQELKRKRRQAPLDSKVSSSNLYPYKSDEDSQL